MSRLCQRDVNGLVKCDDLLCTFCLQKNKKVGPEVSVSWESWGQRPGRARSATFWVELA